MKQPSVESIPPATRALAREVARRLGEHGHRGWIVGGAVRDLALGRPIVDLDMASDARPEEVERLFPQSLGVGRAFGTMLVRDARGVIELTTFRAEDGYSDGRRPDEVRYGVTLEEDAARRDFTCNALYLDPLDDTLADPTGGLADLAAGRLAAVGEPRARLAEDALRLLRLARFAGQLGLEPTAELLAAARLEAPGLARISGERVLAELTRVFERPGTPRASALLVELGLLAARFPSWAVEPERAGRRRRALAALGEAPGAAVGLACLLLDPREDERDELARLHPSRELRRRVEGLWEVASADSDERRARPWALRRLRELGDQVLLRHARALAAAGVVAAEWPAWLERLAAEVPPEARRPAPLLTSADLAAAGVSRGPRWGTLLRAAEDLQLAGRLPDRASALEWLREAAAAPEGRA